MSMPAALLAAMIAAPPAAIIRVDAPLAAAACPRDGDQVTVTADPAHRAETYTIITFDPPVCVIEPDAAAGVPVPQASFLTERPPLKSMLGVLQTFTGSLERGSDGTNQKFTFVTY